MRLISKDLNDNNEGADLTISDKEVTFILRDVWLIYWLANLHFLVVMYSR